VRAERPASRARCARDPPGSSGSRRRASAAQPRARCATMGRSRRLKDSGARAGTGWERGGPRSAGPIEGFWRPGLEQGRRRSRPGHGGDQHVARPPEAARTGRAAWSPHCGHGWVRSPSQCRCEWCPERHLIIGDIIGNRGALTREGRQPSAAVCSPETRPPSAVEGATGRLPARQGKSSGPQVRPPGPRRTANVLVPRYPRCVNGGSFSIPKTRGIAPRCLAICRRRPTFACIRPGTGGTQPPVLRGWSFR